MEILVGRASLRKAGGRLVLVSFNRSHLELFLLTKLAIDLEFFDDEQDAVNSFFPDRAVKRFDLVMPRMDGLNCSGTSRNAAT